MQADEEIGLTKLYLHTDVMMMCVRTEDLQCTKCSREGVQCVTSERMTSLMCLCFIQSTGIPGNSSAMQFGG